MSTSSAVSIVCDLFQWYPFAIECALAAYLAQHYLSVNRASEEDLKAIILIGSIGACEAITCRTSLKASPASWMAIPGAPMYSGSKHGVLGLMSALHPLLEVTNIRIGCVCPFFAGSFSPSRCDKILTYSTDTAIVPPHVKLFLAGIPKTPVSRVARAIFYAATDNVASTNGAAWLLLDSGNVFMVGLSPVALLFAAKFVAAAPKRTIQAWCLRHARPACQCFTQVGCH